MKSFESQLADVDKQIQQRKKTIEVLYMDRVNGDITLPQWSELKSSFEKQLEALSSRRMKLKEEKRIEASRQEREEQLQRKIKYYKNIKKLDSKVVTEFIESITIGEKNKESGKQSVSIKWRY